MAVAGDCWLVYMAVAGDCWLVYMAVAVSHDLACA